jgi:membrane protease YdiL (CAAX protease family)
LDLEQSSLQHRIDGKRFALIALVVFAIEEVVVSIINIAGDLHYIWGFYVFDLTTIFFNWLLPLLIVFVIENRGLCSLGLKIDHSRLKLYLVLVIVCIALPSIFIGLSWELFLEFLEQLVFIGLVEEFFFRGYLMVRFCDWLGERLGLFLNAIIFSLAHLVFLFTLNNFHLVLGVLMVGFQTFMGGLLLGYIFLRAGDIIPGSIIHISLNVFLTKLTN